MLPPTRNRKSPKKSPQYTCTRLSLAHGSSIAERCMQHATPYLASIGLCGDAEEEKKHVRQKSYYPNKEGEEQDNTRQDRTKQNTTNKAK